MNNGYELLTEKEAMFAEMLMQVLRDNEIPCTALSVQGAGFSLATGLQERKNVYVPAEYIARARELYEELFSGDFDEKFLGGEEVQ